MGAAKFKLGEIVNLGAIEQIPELKGFIFGVMECFDGSFLYYVSTFYDSKGMRHMLNEFEIRPVGGE